MFPSYLFFAFIKARERRRAAWNLSRLIGKPLREIGMIIAGAAAHRAQAALEIEAGTKRRLGRRTWNATPQRPGGR